MKPPYIAVFAILPWVAACLSSSGPRAAQSSASSIVNQECSVTPDDKPQLVVLSSSVLGGQGGGPLRSMFGGSVPPQFILYRSGTVLYAANSSRGNEPFYLYRCAKLSLSEKSKIIDEYKFAENMVDPYEFYNARDPEPRSGFNEVLYFDEDDTCRHAELKGSVAAAREASYKIRSTVIAKLPYPILLFLESLATFNPTNSRPWQPEKMLVGLRALDNAPKNGMARPWPTSMKLSTPPAKENRMYRNTIYFEATIPSGQLREFFKAVANPVIFQNRVWGVGYRASFPNDQYWASPFPTLKEPYSICNRYVSHRNFWLLYGLSD